MPDTTTMLDMSASDLADYNDWQDAVNASNGR